jgi:hypothetical protein
MTKLVVVTNHSLYIYPGHSYKCWLHWLLRVNPCAHHQCFFPTAFLFPSFLLLPDALRCNAPKTHIKLSSLRQVSVLTNPCIIPFGHGRIRVPASTNILCWLHIYHKVTCYPAYIYCCLCSAALCPIPVSWSLYYAALHGIVLMGGRKCFLRLYLYFYISLC